jgi:HlyD family secretion protein
MNATTIQNVVTYNTTIEFDNPDLRLFPGMTAYVSIPVAWANNVVKVPNGALRFKPDLTDSERQTLYAKYGIKDNGRATTAGRIGSANAATNDAAPANGGGQGSRNGQGGPAGGTRRAQGGGEAGAGASAGQNSRRAAGGNSQREDTGIVWKLNPDKTLEPIQVGVGVTDFTFTAMMSGKLNPGDDLVIGQSTNKAAQTRSPVGGPGGGPGVPRRF